MEPRVFTRGKEIAQIGRDSVALASMEPRVFTRGNLPVRFATSFRPGGFNGATRLHAWKRDRYARQIPLFEASMEPRVFTRGNPQSRSQNKQVHRASMEPRVFTRGNREVQ